MKYLIYTLIAFAVVLSSVTVVSAARKYYTESRDGFILRLDPATDQNVPEWYQYKTSSTFGEDKCFVFVGRDKKGEITAISNSCRFYQ